jgi:hypothetical protein
MVPLSKTLLSLVTVWGTVVLFFHMMVVPTLIVIACGLNAKLPLSIIVIFIVVGGGVGVGGLGVELGVALVGVEVGVVLVGVGAGFALVGVGLGLEFVGVTPGWIDVGEGAVFSTPAVVVLVLIDAGAFAATPLLPPQPASTNRRATKQRPHKATRLGK